jgi:transcriptional regulator with XRE-family HTH domain
MPRTLGSPRQRVLRQFLIDKRKKAGLTQQQVADRLDVSQSYIASIETGQRRVDVVELMELAEVIHFDPHRLLRKLAQIKS